MADISSDQIVSFIQNTEAQYGGNNAQSQAAVAAAMDQYGVTPAQVASAIGSDTGTIQGIYNKVNPTGTYYVPPATSAPIVTTSGIASVITTPAPTIATGISSAVSTTPTPTDSPAPTIPTGIATVITTPVPTTTQPFTTQVATTQPPITQVATAQPPTTTPAPTSAQGLSANVMTQMEAAYASGDTATLNKLLKDNNVTTSQLQSEFGLSAAQTNSMFANGIQTVDAPTGTDGFANWYAAHPNATNAEIGQAVGQYGITTDQAAAVTGVDSKTARENYLTLDQLQQQNSNLTQGINAITKGGQVTQVGTNDDGTPQYALNGISVTKNPDGSYSYATGNPTRGGGDSLTFTTDANGNVIVPTDLASTYKWSAGQPGSVIGGIKTAVGQGLVATFNAAEPAIAMALSMNPATAPFMAAASAYSSFKSGNIVQGVISALSAAGAWGQQQLAAANAAAAAGDTVGAASILDQANSWLASNAGNLKTAANVVSGINAVDKGNYVGALTAAANVFNTGVNKDVNTALNLASAATAMQKGDTTSLLLAVSNLTGSQDAKTAAAATQLQNALNSGNQNSIFTAFKNLAGAANVALADTSTTAPPSTTAAPTQTAYTPYTNSADATDYTAQMAAISHDLYTDSSTASALPNFVPNVGNIVQGYIQPVMSTLEAAANDANFSPSKFADLLGKAQSVLGATPFSAALKFLTFTGGIDPCLLYTSPSPRD